MTNRLVSLDEAIAIVRAGELVAIPTETVYGLAARADDAAAIGRIFEAKGRPRGHPLIVHVADASGLDACASEVPPSARRIADVLWPGPVTLVVRRSSRVLDAVTGGRDTVAVRVPRHPLALALIRATGAVAAPSANVFGRVSPTSAAHVMSEPFARDVAVLDGGPCEVGLESTIIDVTEPVPTLLRPGGVPVETIEAILGAPIADGRGGEARAPGMLASHYAPRARVIAVRSIGEAERAGGAVIDASGDDAEVARTLYARLRELDASGADVIAVVLPEEAGLGLAIADRVRRASR
jgi:L-threonylcarbamoyladenylate synthase